MARKRKSRKIHSCDAVLMLIREKPGRTRNEITKEAVSLRAILSLLPRKPFAAMALWREFRDFTKSPEQGAVESVNAAYNLGYVEEASDGTFWITMVGRERLRAAGL